MMTDDGTAPADERGSALVGRSLGRYRIVGWVGAGGMGEVYRANDEQLDRHIAIKVLPQTSVSNTAARARLIREARTASQLNHPNICTIHEVGEADGRAYIAMELLDGQSLSARLTAGPLTPDQILRYALQLAEALRHAHGRGIVHRDLKSANVIVTSDDRIKVLDFGLAKPIVAGDGSEMTATVGATITQPGMLIGTPAYMAPEQLRGQPADVRSDIWALGVVLYEMASGCLPFAGLSAFEVIGAVLNASPPPLSDRVPAGIASIVGRCLEKDPERRFRDAGEILSALQRAGAASLSTFSRRPALHPRIVIGAVAAALAAALAIAAALDVGNMRQRAVALFWDDVIAFAERDWLLVADFENQTADKVFDKSLDTALAVGMGQSSYVNIVPESRIQGALRRMKVSAASQIDRATAREIAQREGIRLVLVPSIGEVGGVYQLSGSLQDPATGTVLKATVVRAQRKEDVLNGLDELIRRIRSDLGEAGRSISQQSKPLAEVTTSSLEALKVFSLAREAHRAARVDEARGLYEEALRLDPSFTSARASLGILNFEWRDRVRGQELLAQSIKDVDGLTDKERYTVLGWHAQAVENNPQKAADYWAALLAIYPDMWSASNNLGRSYMQMGRWGEAVEALKRAVRLEPNVMLTYNSLSQIYLDELGDLDAALAICRQQLSYDDQQQYAYDKLGWALLGKGDLAQAREAFQKAIDIDPRATLDLSRLGHVYRLEGRYREAVETFLRIPPIDPAERSAYYDAGVASRLLGDERAARSHFLRYRRLIERQIEKESRKASLHLELAIALSRLGDNAGAASAAQQAMAIDPNQHFEYAGFLSLEGRSAEAIDELQRAVDRGFRDFVWMKIHEDLEPLAAAPKFQALVAAGLKS
jgi:eukaryotic-like serine/threonine-protein kinase